ncbi:MAG: NADH-quinone oxidoreductase subunit NuoK [Streptosporangiales bacterium]|nr:NADH-quinone oxidoreductase subunit NuoK [Streptosporangiales bacterium]
MHLAYPLVLGALLFSVGVYGVLARRNAILMLMSVELMLNAVNISLVAFDLWRGDAMRGGQVLTLYVIVIAAAEVGLGLAIILLIFRNRATVDVDRLTDLADRDPAPDEGPDRDPVKAAAAGPPGDADPSGATAPEGARSS